MTDRSPYAQGSHPPVNRAPEFPAVNWLNADQPLTLASLHGQATLIHFWDYTSIHCLRTLPYIKEWSQRYNDLGLTVIGVHSPEFAFGRERTQVELALQEMDVHYPVALDNDFAVWNAYNNVFYPAFYVLDSAGFVRYAHYGEGAYDELEAAIQAILRERDQRVSLPPLMTPLRPEDYPEVLRYRPTPQLRGGLQRGALGNPEGYAGGVPVIYSLPGQRKTGAFYVAGAWLADSQYIVYSGQHEGIISVPYEASEVHAILSPHPDTVERILHPLAVDVEIWQDDRPIHDHQRGADVTEDGRLIVNRPRAYNLIRNPKFESHELTLRVKTHGFALYAFAFTGAARD